MKLNSHLTLCLVFCLLEKLVFAFGELERSCSYGHLIWLILKASLQQLQRSSPDTEKKSDENVNILLHSNKSEMKINKEKKYVSTLLYYIFYKTIFSTEEISTFAVREQFLKNISSF